MSSQQLFLIVLGVGLLLVAGIFGWRQVRMIGWLREQSHLSLEDRIYFRRQVVRRLLGCLLLAILAAQIGGLFYFDLFGRLDQIGAKGDQAKADAEAKGIKVKPEDLDDQDREFLNFGLTYLMFMALTILVMMLVAIMDVMAIRRYGMRHRRRIREDRQAMLERQLPQLKWGRGNGTTNDR